MNSNQPNSSTTITDDQYIATFNSEFNYDDELYAEFESEQQISKKRSKRELAATIFTAIGAIAGVVSAAVGIGALVIAKNEIKKNDQRYSESKMDVEKIKQLVNQNNEAIRQFEVNVNKKFEQSMIRFEEIEKKVDNVLTTIQIAKVEILDRIEEAKEEILQGIKYSRIKPIVSHLSSFLDFFTSQAQAVSALPLKERIAVLEKAGGIMDILESSKTPQTGTLYTLLSDIINEGFAVPTSENDEMSLAILQLLFYGMNVYVFIMYFLVQQYALLTANYWHKNDIEKYNKLYLSCLVTFKDFLNTLINSNHGILHKVTRVFDTVKHLHFIQKDRKDVIDFVDKSLANFRSIHQVLNQLSESFVSETPSKVDNKLNFSESKSKTPLQKWKSGASVYYAIQFVGNHNQMSSLISDWSSGYSVDDLANPIVRIPTDPQGRTRVVFRKFDNYQPEIVAVIKDSTSREFRDINRDLYNAASQPNEKVALKDIVILIENGANVNASFEQNKTAIHVATENNNWNVAYALIQNGSNINAQDDKGHSPIYIAAESGYETFVRNLVQNGANVNVRANKAQLELTPLHTADYRGHKSIVQFLLQLNQTDLNAQSSNGFTPLHFAASFNQTDIVRLLVADKRTELNVKSEQQFTPLHLASINNCVQVAEVLLGTKSVDWNAQTGNKATPLHLASLYGSEKVVASLLKYGADIDAKSANGSTVVHYAAAMGNQAIISSVTSESTVNAQNDFEITPLYVAYQYNNTKAATKLINEHCANANIRFSEHKTLLHLATLNGDIMAVQNLINQKVDVDVKDVWERVPLYYAVQYGRIEIARMLLQNNANPNVKDVDNKPILHLVLELNEIDALNMAKVLVQNRANVNITNQFDNTLLHLASMKGYLSIIKFLLEKGADVNAKNINNDTPLRLNKVWLRSYNSDTASFLTQKGAQDSGNNVDFLDACFNGKLNLIKYLYGVRAVDIHVKDSDTQNALFRAIDGKGNLEVVQYLVLIGVSIYKIILMKEFKEGYTLVHYAVDNNKFDIFKYLIEKGADFKSGDKRKRTPLHNAAYNNNLEMVKYLLHLGLDVNVIADSLNPWDVRSEGMTPLIDSIYGKGDLKLVKYLINSGAQTTQRSGKTALTWATERNRQDIKQYLEQVPTDPTLQTQIDTNSLFFAAAQNNLKLVEQYLNKNISVNVMDEDDGQTPLYRAIYYNGQLDMIELLISKGADVKQFDVTKLENLVYLSIVKRKFDVAKCLIENGANFQTAGISSNTPLHGAIEAESIDMLKYLLDKDSHNNHKNSAGKTAFDLLIEARNEKLIMYLVFEYRDKQERTMLHKAAAQGDIMNVKFLLERGAHVNAADKLKNTPMHLAAQNGHLEAIKLLMQQNCVDIFVINSYKQTALLVAQYNHKDDIAEYLSEHMIRKPKSLTRFRMSIFSLDSIPSSRKDLYIRLSEHNTMLHLAAIKDDIKALHSLIDQKMPVDAKDVWGRAPLYYAVQKGRTEISRILLQNNANPNAKDADNKPVLHLVADLDEIDALNMAKVLVQNRANVNITDKFDNTLLHIAIKKGYFTIIKFLLEKGTDVNAKNINNDTPLRLAKVLQSNSSDIASFLTQKGAQDSGNNVDFLDACYKGNLNLIKYLHEVLAVDVHVKTRIRDIDSQNALSSAISGNGNLEVVKYLVNIGVSIHESFFSRRFNGIYTLVNYAVVNNKFDIFKYLIEKGADFKLGHHRNREGTPLLNAASNNNLEMVKYLLHLGLNVNVIDSLHHHLRDHLYEDMILVIHCSIIGKGDLKLVKYLIKSCTFPRHFLDRFLTWATKNNKPDIKQYLEQLPTDPTLQTQIDTSSLFFAAAQNNLKLVEQCLNKNISVNVMDEDDGQTPLYRAIYYNGQLDMIKLLISKGANVKQFDLTKLENLVYLSIVKYKIDVAMYLIENGADFKTAGISGNTPLHGAIEAESSDMLKYLLDKDAHNNHKNSAGKTPFDLLIEGRNDKLIEYLVLEYQNKEKLTLLLKAASQSDNVNVQFLLERGKRHLISVDKQYNLKHDVADYLSQQMKSKTKSLTHLQMPSLFDDSIPPSSDAMPTKRSPAESVDLNSTLFLTDVIARKYTGQQYFNAHARSVSPAEARTYSLNLVQQYEQLLAQLAASQNVSQVLECDFFSLYRTIERYMLSGQYSRIDRLLYSHAHKALSTRDTHIDNSLLIQMIDRLLIETGKQRATSSIVESHLNISDIEAKTKAQIKPKLIDTNTKQQYVC